MTLAALRVDDIVNRHYADVQIDIVPKVGNLAMIDEQRPVLGTAFFKGHHHLCEGNNARWLRLKFSHEIKCKAHVPFKATRSASVTIQSVSSAPPRQCLPFIAPAP